MPSTKSNSRTTRILALLLSSALLGAGGIAPAAQQPSANSPNFQAYLLKEVRHQLVLLPYYSVFDILKYKVEGTKVTLSGSVISTHAVLKDDAQKAVKSIEGVESVDNQIEILPPAPFDDQIREAEFQAIYGFGGLHVYASRAVAPIHIIVKGGHVSLEGTVALTMDKEIAGIRANTVSNVFSVANNLVVDKDK